MPSNSNVDDQHMRLALLMAQTAASKGEVPVGAVVVVNGDVIATGYNQKELNNDCTAHAEMIALKKASERLGRWRLTEATIYVNLEPCIMCAGAMLHARVAKCVYGLPDAKFGALGSNYSLHSDDRLNHTFEVETGLMQSESKKLIQTFFKSLRKK